MMLRARGFTLLELIVVIFIIGVVSTFALLTREDEVDINRLIIEAEKASSKIIATLIEARNSQSTIEFIDYCSNYGLRYNIYTNKQSNQLYTYTQSYGSMGIGAIRVADLELSRGSYQHGMIFDHSNYLGYSTLQASCFTQGRYFITSDGHIISNSSNSLSIQFFSKANPSIKSKVEISALGYPRIYVSDQRINNGQYREVIR